MSEFDDIARELHATRAEPRPEYARELDQRAAEWLRERSRRRLPALRIAVPAAAAAAAVAALVVSGGGEEGKTELQIAVVSDQGAAEALGAPLRRDAADPAAEGSFSVVKTTRVEAGQPVILRYFFTASTSGTVELAGREGTLTVGPGSGRVKISTEGLPSGSHTLEIAVPSTPLYRERIEIGR